MDLVKVFGEELAEQIKAKLPEAENKLILNEGNNWVPKATFNERVEKFKTERDDYKQQLETLQGEVKKLETLTGENAELKTKIDSIQADSEKAKADLEKRLQDQQFDFKLTEALIKAGAKNTAAVKALLKRDSITLDGANFIGLNDQLDALKKDESYLFGETKPAGTLPNAGGNPKPEDKPKTRAEEYGEMFK